jgi:AraC-like DNA-binding protein
MRYRDFSTSVRDSTASLTRKTDAGENRFGEACAPSSAIADIALQVGFSSQSHLTQQFKRLTGMTPKQIR